jgi:hypothetical protein
LEDIDPADLDAGVITPDDMGWTGNQENVIIGAPAEDEVKTAEKVNETTKAPTRLKAARTAPSLTEARTGIPTIDEWMDFFSRVVIRVGTDWLTDWAFRGIDEDLLSDREIETVRLTQEERDRIAKPFAELAYKNKFTRKHGREIIATAGSIDALLQIALWYSRVNRIAMKYRKLTQQKVTLKQTTRPMPQSPPTVQREGVSDERVGSDTPHTSANGHVRPDIGGDILWNPDRA